MRTLGGLGIALLLAGGLFAQRGNFVNTQPVLTGGFGNVVYPGGTPATVPGLTRSFGNVVNPGGGGPRLVVPGSHQGVRPQRTGAAGLVYAYPLYVGGYGYNGYMGSDAPYDPSQQQQQPNVTVVYPPQPAPVIINQYGSGDNPPAVRPRMYEMPSEPQADTAPAESESSHYLIAFKDHTIYSAVAYWVDGDTLHYFTAGNTHNQASLSLVDRDLTLRLNQESGVNIKLPAAKQ